MIKHQTLLLKYLQSLYMIDCNLFWYSQKRTNASKRGSVTTLLIYAGTCALHWRRYSLGIIIRLRGAAFNSVRSNKSLCCVAIHLNKFDLLKHSSIIQVVKLKTIFLSERELRNICAQLMHGIISIIWKTTEIKLLRIRKECVKRLYNLRIDIFDYLLKWVE